MIEPLSPPDRALRTLDRVVGLLATLGGVIMLALVAVTAVAVFYRYVVNDPIFGVYDVSKMVLSLVVTSSLAYGGRAGAHVAVDILGMLGGRGITRWTDIVVRVLGIAIMSLTVYALVKQGSCGFRCGHFTPDLAIPFLPFYMFMAAGMTLYALVLLAELIVGIAHFADPVDPSEKG